MMQALHCLLDFSSLNATELDVVVWLPDAEAGYSTKNRYNVLLPLRYRADLDISIPSCFEVFWKALMPFRVKAFG